MQTHYLMTSLQRSPEKVWGVDSRARLAIEASQRACVVFIHGFKGGATSTWLEFPRLLPLEDGAAGFDLFFYGYDGSSDSVAYSSTRFLEFLEAVATSPARDVVNPSLPAGAPLRPNDWQYDRLIICGHSLGAVVTRAALIEANRTDPPPSWPSRVRLVFFAPAHNGAKVVKLVSEALAGLPLPFVGGKTAVAIAKMRMQVLLDLEEGSETISALRAETKALLAQDATRHAYLRAHVAHARGDRIVIDKPFVQDYRTKYLENQGHASMCKPQPGYVEPLEFLLGRMRDR